MKRHLFCSCKCSTCHWCMNANAKCQVCGWEDDVSPLEQECIVDNILDEELEEVFHPMSYEEQERQELQYEYDARADYIKEAFGNTGDCGFDDVDLPPPYPICSFEELIDDMMFAIEVVFDQKIKQCAWENDPLPF